MEDVKKKYDEFESSFDEQAWEHFKTIKDKEPKSKRRILLWWRLAAACLVFLVIASVVFFKQKNNVSSSYEYANIEVENNMSDLEQSDVIADLQADQDNDVDTFSHNGDIAMALDKVMPHHYKKQTSKRGSGGSSSFYDYNTGELVNKASKGKDTEYTYSSPIASSYGESVMVTPSTKEAYSDLAVANGEQDSSSSTVSFHESSTSEEVKNKVSEEAEVVADVDELDTNSNSIEAMEKPLDDSRYGDDVITGSSKLFPFYNNFIKANIGLMDSFDNSIRHEKEAVNKRGVKYSIEYYRVMSDLFALGVSAGYASTRDVNNNYERIVDYEKSSYLHGSIYLLLLNRDRSQCFIKAGTGLTQTKREYAYPIYDILSKPNLNENNTSDLGEYFRIEKSLKIGYTLEAAYLYRLNSSLHLGVHYTILKHNQGGQAFGLSIARSF